MIAKEQRSSTPFHIIIVHGKLDATDEICIVADHQVLFKVKGGIVEAVVAFFSCYYVFIFKYPASLNNLYLYLQNCIFNIPNNQKLPTSVITFINAIANFSKAKEDIGERSFCESGVTDQSSLLEEEDM